MRALIERLADEKTLNKEEFLRLLGEMTDEDREYLIARAATVRAEQYGDRVFVRGLIEFTNYCKNNCYYCGIRADNANAERYRLDKDDILACCSTGHSLGIRTFVLQGGEDPYYTDDRMIAIIGAIKSEFPDCAITLSIGEKSFESYKRFFDAGADRYLLRHETANAGHYAKLHPENLTAQNRRECLYNLKDIGFQVGAGFMVGSPYQTAENITEDLLFLKELQPHMVGIGPFIPQSDTPFADQESGNVELTTTLLAIIRLMLPSVLLPSTTALGTIHPKGREMGLQAGANVVMPNLSPLGVRKKYLLYDNKICTGEEAAECIKCLENRIRSAGFTMDFARGDHLEWRELRCL